jgi:hypothetical protein
LWVDICIACPRVFDLRAANAAARLRIRISSGLLRIRGTKRRSLSSKMAHPSNAFNTNPAVQVIPNGSGLGAVAAEQRRGEEQHEPRGSGRPIDGASTKGTAYTWVLPCHIVVCTPNLDKSYASLYEQLPVVFLCSDRHVCSGRPGYSPVMETMQCLSAKVTMWSHVTSRAHLEMRGFLHPCAVLSVSFFQIRPLQSSSLLLAH